MYTYVSGTWLISNLIHPFMLFIVFGWEGAFNSNAIGFGFQFLFYSIIFSMPSLLLSLLAMYGIFKLRMYNKGRFVTWLIMAPLIVFINYWLLFGAFLSDGLDKESFDFMLPGMLSAVLVILIRYPAFFRSANELNKIKEEKELKKSNESF